MLMYEMKYGCHIVVEARVIICISLHPLYRNIIFPSILSSRRHIYRQKENLRHVCPQEARK